VQVSQFGRVSQYHQTASIGWCLTGFNTGLVHAPSGITLAVSKSACHHRLEMSGYTHHVVSECL
jgi:hypothetical protein